MLPTLSTEAELEQSQGPFNLTPGFQCRQSGDSPRRSYPSPSVPSELQQSTAASALCTLEQAALCRDPTLSPPRSHSNPLGICSYLGPPRCALLQDEKLRTYCCVSMLHSLNMLCVKPALPWFSSDVFLRGGPLF